MISPDFSLIRFYRAQSTPNSHWKFKCKKLLTVFFSREPDIWWTPKQVTATRCIEPPLWIIQTYFHRIYSKIFSPDAPLWIIQNYPNIFKDIWRYSEIFRDIQRCIEPPLWIIQNDSKIFSTISEKRSFSPNNSEVAQWCGRINSPAMTLWH